MNRRTERFALRGYSGEGTTGTAIVASLDRNDRLRRAISGLATAWAFGVLALFIPVAHFVLVPAAVVTGIIVFVRRLRTITHLSSVRGRCPDCGTDQAFEARGPWELPRQFGCRHCHRSLTARHVDRTASVSVTDPQ